MAAVRKLSRRQAESLGARERKVGLDADDAAARWLGEHDPPPEPKAPKAATKSKTLHRFRQRQQQNKKS
jgi:hypothetical protein